LVFTSAYLNNPASLFGHTLLRLDRRGEPASTQLLAYAVSYAADDSGSTGLMYGIKGIAGGFTGYFELQSYDRLVRTYSDIENRDIWEYRLNLTPGQMARLVAHLWELREVRFDYYFFSENCAWQLLTLLEVADPSRVLSDRFALWVAPPDVLRLINAKPGWWAALHRARHVAVPSGGAMPHWTPPSGCRHRPFGRMSVRWRARRFRRLLRIARPCSSTWRWICASAEAPPGRGWGRARGRCAPR
jgi:hypothetical protein